MHLAVHRHIHDQIAKDACLTAETSSGRDRPQSITTRLDWRDWANMCARRDDAVLGEIAFHRLDLAATTKAPAAADRIKINFEMAGRLEQRRAQRKAAALAGRQKDDEGLIVRRF